MKLSIHGQKLARPLLFLAAISFTAFANEPKRIDRADAFLGIHFDFHANQNDTNVGARTTREMVASIIERVHPDYIQCDCKGHAGYSSYPTKVGNPAPGIVEDPLRIWRDVTSERGVALFMHYSGLYDAHAVKTHPGWAAVRADGKADERATSPFGPYADQLLIPQLRELADVYGVDGAWVDGECWAAIPDYGEASAHAFHEKFQAKPPHKRGEPLWFEWLDFNREAFRAYLRHYVDALRSSNPEFKIISNWAFSDHMPEPVSANVGSLSGDFSPQDSVNSARFTARCFENQGRAWDLMSWGFNGKTRQQKTAIALEQEAAIVLALCGGYQCYFKQDRDGAVQNPNDLEVMHEVAKFCRERQAFCHKSEPLPQIALLYSRAAHYRNADGLFKPYGDPGITSLKQTLNALLAIQQSVQVVSEHHLAGKMSPWPLIVVPAWNYLEPPFRDELTDYVKNGGHLLLVGNPALAHFSAALGATNVVSSGTTNLWNIGRGKIAAVPTATNLEWAVKQMFPAPKVEVAGSPAVDVCIRRLNGKLMVNLVNTSGNHANQENLIVTSVPPVGPLQITIHTAKKPRAIIVQPGGQKLKSTWQDGITRVALPRLELYSILQIEI